VKVQFEKHVHGCFATASTYDVWLVKALDLPIAPFPGMAVYERGSGWFEAEVKSVMLRREESGEWTIVAVTDPDRELYEADLHRHAERRDIETIVGEWLEMGWERKP